MRVTFVCWSVGNYVLSGFKWIILNKEIPPVGGDRWKATLVMLEEISSSFLPLWNHYEMNGRRTKDCNLGCGWVGGLGYSIHQFESVCKLSKWIRGSRSWWPLITFRPFPSVIVKPRKRLKTMSFSSPTPSKSDVQSAGRRSVPSSEGLTPSQPLDNSHSGLGCQISDGLLWM